MKKINIITTIIAIFALLQFSSCTDFLDVKPNNSIQEEDFVVRTRSDAKVMMDGIMRNVVSGSYYGRNMFLYADARGSDLTVASQGRGYDYLYSFNHTAASNNGSGYWSQIYYCLLQVNTLLQGMEKTEGEGGIYEDFSQYKGQALTLRALMYFDLVRIYGKPYTYSDAPNSYGVPIVTKPIDRYQEVTRATVSQVYAQIQADLTAAATLLNTTSGKAKSNGYINYYGNRVLQARVYLYMGKYDDALTVAEEIINSNAYTLYTNANWITSWSTQFNTESIFELGVFSNEADLGTSSLGALTIRRGNVSSSIAGYFIASDYFLERFNKGYDGVSASTRDVRWDIMYYDETSTTRMGSCRKHTGGNNTSGDGKGSYSLVNIKVMRLSEVYLIAAESALLKSAPDRAKAANYLQAIRKRGQGLAPATAETVDLDMILDERSIELFMEGHRFFDLVRHKKTIEFNDDRIDVGHVSANNRTKVINENGSFFYKCILPIPKAETDANPAIAAQQNPGY